MLPTLERKKYLVAFDALIDRFWRTYEDRLERGIAHLVHNSLSDDQEPPAPYDPEAHLSLLEKMSRYNVPSEPYSPLLAYSQGAQFSLERGWLEFIMACGEQNTVHMPERHGTVRPLIGYEHITHAKDTRDVVEKTKRLGREHTKTVNPPSNFDLVMAGVQGCSTAAATTLYCVALAQRYSSGNAVDMALLFSKTGLAKLEELGTAIREKRAICPHSKSGTNMDVLKELGFGTTLGCPASFSFETNTIAGYVRRVEKDYNTRVLKWYRALPEERRSLIAPYDRELLDAPIQP